MFKEDKEIETLLNHQNNILHKSVGQGKSLFPKHNGIGSASRLTIQEKADIGTLANIIGSKAAAEMVGEDPGSVNRLKNAKTIYNGEDRNLKTVMDKRLEPIRNTAIDKVDLLLGIISEAKASDLGIRDAAIAADKLVSIYEKLTPGLGKVNIDRSNVVFYSPRVRELKDYNVLEVEPTIG